MSVFEGCELKTEKVTLPNGNVIVVQEMGGRQRDEFDRALFRMTSGGKKKGGPVEADPIDIRNELILRTVCDENGEFLFTNINDVQEQLSIVPSRIIAQIFEVSSELNGLAMSEEQVKADLANFQ